MFPEIVRIGPFALYTYGFMMMLAFTVGIFFSIYRGKKVGIASGTIWDLALVILFASLTGARGLYVLTHLSEFQGHWFDVINPIQANGKVGIAGMVLLGGVVTATVAAIIYIRWKKLSPWKLADIIAPALALGIALGRIGCFANGCCYGQPTDAFCGVIFPDTSPAGSHFPDTPVLPTQLFSTTWNLILLAVMLFAERWKKFDGFTFALFLVGYSVFRIWVDTVRIYEPEEFIVHTETLRITVSQAISAGLIVFGVALFLVLRKKGAV